jgi:hypothetical protein
MGKVEGKVERGKWKRKGKREKGKEEKRGLC